MDGALIGGIVAAITGCVPATIGALALLKKATAGDAAARRWVQSVIDLVAAGVVYGIPDNVMARGHRILEAERDDDRGGPKEPGTAAHGGRRADADDGGNPRDLRGVSGGT